MSKIATTFFIVLIFCNVLIAQWTQTSGPSGGTVSQLAVNQTDGSVFAVASGDAYRSTNNGASWTPLTNTLPADIGATVVTASGSTVYLGYTGTLDNKIVYRSTDNGDTWTKATCTGIPSYYFPAAMIVIGSKLLMSTSYLIGGGKMFASTDGGENWTESGTGLPVSLVVAYFTMNGSDIYAASSIISTVKGVYKSTDNGANWTATTLASSNTVNGLTSNSVGIFASTNLNGVHRSTDDGGTWTKINPTSSTNFATSVIATNSNLFVGLGGYMYKADQNGDGWDSIRTGLPQANAGTGIYSLAVSGSSLLCAYSSKGIYRTTNNGTNWFQSHDGIRALKIDGIHASNGFVFAAGDAYGHFRSSDHGTTWTEINNGISPTAGWFCFARVGSDILAGAGSSLLYRSSDNGDNWTLSNTGFGLTNSFAFFVEGTTVYTTGLAGVAKSTDGGLTWTTLSSGYLGYEGGLDIWKDGANILTGTSLGKHRSTDDGATWNAPITGITGAVGSFAQMDSTLFAASSFGVYKSTDHGANWSATASFPLGVGPKCLAVIEQDLYAGTNDGVYRSTDKGTSWTAINDGFASKTTIYKLAYDDQYLYAGTTTRSVWWRALSEITNVNEVSNIVPTEFSLEQNYPNPFNPLTNFGFRIVDFGLVTLKIFDILGREVATLVNENLHPGTFSVTWDATGQASGVYYYRLQASDYSATRKLLLTK